MTGNVSKSSQGFTLTEILIALFILALGVVGIMSLFPVGLDATNRAINNNVVYLAGQTAFAQVNYMVNTTETIDIRARRQFYFVSSRADDRRNPRRVVYYVGDLGAGASYQVPLMPFAENAGRTCTRRGYYLSIVSGAGAGQVRKISGVTYSSPTSAIELMTDLSEPLDSSSAFVVTRWALPRRPGSRRIAIVWSANSTTITAAAPESDMSASPPRQAPVNWRTHEFTPDTSVVDGRFFVVFIGNTQARGKVLPIEQQVGTNALRVRSGIFSPTSDFIRPGQPNNRWLNTADTTWGRVRQGDAFMILGTKEVDAIFPFGSGGRPSNFGQEPGAEGAELPDQTIPFGAAQLAPEDLENPNALPRAPYSYVVILSNPEDVNPAPVSWWQSPIPIPRDAFDPTMAGQRARAAPAGARVDVLVFQNYDYSRPIWDQSPQTLIGTTSTTIASIF